VSFGGFSFREMSLRIFPFLGNIYASARGSRNKFILDKQTTVGKMPGECPTL
jgi:hypothetical protein